MYIFLYIKKKKYMILRLCTYIHTRKRLIWSIFYSTLYVDGDWSLSGPVVLSFDVSNQAGKDTEYVEQWKGAREREERRMSGDVRNKEVKSRR
jgi:hypothetical protein